MATTFDSFCLPPKFSEFIPYPGPPKSKPARSRARREAEPDTDEWIGIDRLLADVPECLDAPNGGAATSGARPREGSSPQHPAVIEGAPAHKKNNKEVEEGTTDAADTETRGVQAEPEPNSLLSVPDGQTYNPDGGDMSPHLPLAQHCASPEDEFMNRGDGFELETSPLKTQMKRRRSTSPDTSALGQTPERISEQDDAGAHSPSPKRRKSPPLLNNYCVSPSASTLKLSSSPSPIVTEPPVANTSGRGFGSNDNNDADIGSNHGLDDSESDAIDHDTKPHDALIDDWPDMVSQPSLLSRQSPSGGDGSERLHDTNGLEARGDGGNRCAGGCEVVAVGGSDGANSAADAAAVGAIASTGHLDSVDSPLPEKSTAEGPLHRADVGRLPEDENERRMVRWKRRHSQRKPPSSATRNAPATAIKPPRSSRARLLEHSRMSVKFAPSRYQTISPSPSPRKRPSATEVKSMRGRSEGNDGSWREAAPQKLTQMSLRPLPTGESFLAAVIQDDRDLAAFAYDQSMTLIHRTLGDTRQVDSIAVTPLTLNSWLLTGYLRPDLEAAESDVDNITATHATSSNSGLETDPGTHSESDSGCLSEDGDSTDNDTDLGHNSLCSSDEDESDDLGPIVGRRRRPWTRSDEDLLRQCVARKDSWDKIARQLHRTESAARQHWTIMGEKGEKPLRGRRKRAL